LAIEKVRKGSQYLIGLFKVAILATGTMLDNTWADVFALVSLLRGHPFTSMLRMREVFTDGLKTNPRPKNLNTIFPKGVKLERLVHILHACMLSRPSKTVTKDMEDLHEEVIKSDVAKQDRENSNKALRKRHAAILRLVLEITAGYHGEDTNRFRLSHWLIQVNMRLYFESPVRRCRSISLTWRLRYGNTLRFILELVHKFHCEHTEYSTLHSPNTINHPKWRFDFLLSPP